MKSKKFNKEKYAEQKTRLKAQRNYKCYGTAIVIPINNSKHKILATAIHDDTSDKDQNLFELTLSIAKETNDMPIWHQFEDCLKIRSKRHQLRSAILAKVIELEAAGDFDIYIESADAVYKLLECAGDYLSGQSNIAEVM